MMNEEKIQMPPYDSIDPPLPYEKKIERIRKLNELVARGMQTPVSDPCCKNCEHFRDGKCAAREMKEIPAEVIQRTYRCKRWYEKDFIPF